NNVSTIDLHPFPTRRSSDLKIEPDDPNPTWHRQAGKLIAAGQVDEAIKLFAERGRFSIHSDRDDAILNIVRDWSVGGMANPDDQDRKSTRLNSSHEWISYAV